MRSPIVKAYLERFAGEVQRFFPIPKGSAVEAFNDLAPRYPVFELEPLDETAPGAESAPRQSHGRISGLRFRTTIGYWLSAGLPSATSACHNLRPGTVTGNRRNAL
jgi:hypothetical protein